MFKPFAVGLSFLVTSFGIAGLAEVRRDVAEVRRDVGDHRKETAAGFAAFDAELAKHSDPTHRKVEEAIAELRKDVDALKRRPARPAARRR